MSSLSCHLCQRDLTNLEGDVVIDRRDGSDPNAPDRLRLVCQGCLARPETAERFQTMWGLAWLRGHYLGITRKILTDQASGRPWPTRAIDDFVGLGYFLLPGQHPAAGEGAD